MRVLDSHLHLWDPSRLSYSWLEGPLLARFAAEEAIVARGAGSTTDAGSHAAVFVQADCAPEQYLDEVDWVSSIAEEAGVRGIVAGARLDERGSVEHHLDALRARPLVVGVRHLLQSEPAGFARTDAFVAGARALAARDLSFDACVRGVEQLGDVAALASAVPDLRIVLDHLGKPEIGTADAPRGPEQAWITAISAVAAHPQVACKLSGLPAEAGGSWSAAQVQPFFDVALSVFGPDRLMIGSDWPVSAVTAAGWAGESGTPIDADAVPAWTDAVAGWARSRGIDVDDVLWRNAERFYPLSA